MTKVETIDRRTFLKIAGAAGGVGLTWACGPLSNAIQETPVDGSEEAGVFATPIAIPSFTPEPISEVSVNKEKPAISSITDVAWVGNSLAVAVAGEKGYLYLVNPDEPGNIQRLFPIEAGEIAVHNKQIFYREPFALQLQNELCVRGVDGYIPNEESFCIDSKGLIGGIALAPDGSLLAVNSHRGLLIADIENGRLENERRLSINGIGGSKPTISPLGDKIGVSLEMEGGREIAILNLFSKEVLVLHMSDKTDGRDNRFPAWLPSNDDYLVYASHFNGVDQLMSLNVIEACEGIGEGATCNPQEIASINGRVVEPLIISPNNQNVVGVAELNQGETVIFANKIFEPRVEYGKGGIIAYGRSPSVSKDDRVAFISNDNGSLLVTDFWGNEPKEVIDIKNIF